MKLRLPRIILAIPALLLFVAQANAQSSTVVINEIMALNTVTVTDNFGEYEDWVELYNTSANSVPLTGWYLSDNPLNLPKWEFPSGSSIAPGAYMIVWADEDSIQGPYHANFKLSSTLGESLYLLNASLNIVDSVQFGPQTADIAYARVPNGTGPFVNQTHTYNSANSATAITAPIAGPALLAFPNPCNSVLFVRNLGTEPKVITIHNTLGAKVHESSIEGTASIPTDALPSGVYILQSNNTVQKFVVGH